MDKNRALKKVEKAIDKIIELEDYEQFSDIADPQVRILELLRQLANRLN